MTDLLQPPEQAVHAPDATRRAALRSLAASRLSGPAASKGDSQRAVDALGVLHALASSPGTADDALTLLHELQVHQVELDLQAQELQESRAEIESALRQQTALHEALPVGCCTVDARLVLHALNRRGADLLRLGRGDVQGLALDTLCSTDSARRLRAAVASVGAGPDRGPAACLLQLHPHGGDVQPVLASIGPAPETGRFLVTLAPLPADLQPAAVA
ncbi:hypothetical protein ACPOLB_00680 [Rubrivivax sp. RP6-9]|uniref:hypothetical protein n=1 Tax=Rubrivivax sp. RP6-9 TaxID=3415750 RepID=UPI003CC56A65